MPITKKSVIHTGTNLKNTSNKLRQFPPLTNYIIGIDEAGRGPLAGPLVVAGVMVNLKFKTMAEKLLGGIKDSKKLTPKKREKWFLVITNSRCFEWASARITPKIIDKINIARAANFGAKVVFQKLSRDKNCHALLDGSLYLPKDLSYQTIAKGDEKIKIISAASIIAKVTRDRIMARLHKKYPQYGFKKHKGYGTKSHYEAIKKFGPSEIHRKSFKLEPISKIAFEAKINQCGKVN